MATESNNKLLEERDAKAAAAKRQANLQTESKIGQAIPGLSSDMAARVRQLGGIMHSVGASTQEVVSKLSSSKPQQGKGVEKKG